MTENEKINGWTFEETVKTAENLMEAENNMFKWDVLRHLRDFAENFKYELEQYRAIGTIEELKSLQEDYWKLNEMLKFYSEIGTVEEFKALKEEVELYRNLDKTNFSDGYAKAIDEFAATLIPRLTDAIYQKDVESMTNLINDVARELKAGDNNE